MSDCRCMTPPFHYADYEREFIGRDSRFGEVSIETCKHCGQKWLEYFFEHEAFTASGQWYRGILTPKMQLTLTTETALDLLESLPWHLCGGSYFRTSGVRSEGPIRGGSIFLR